MAKRGCSGLYELFLAIVAVLTVYNCSGPYIPVLGYRRLLWTICSWPGLYGAVLNNSMLFWTIEDCYLFISI